MFDFRENIIVQNNNINDGVSLIINMFVIKGSFEVVFCGSKLKFLFFMIKN